MKILIIINDATYGTEKDYNAFRLAMTLCSEHDEVETLIFLMADAVGCAVPGQKTPKDYHNIETMLEYVIDQETQIRACGDCLLTRGLENVQLIKGVNRSTMPEFTHWNVDADKIISYFRRIN